MPVQAWCRVSPDVCRRDVHKILSPPRLPFRHSGYAGLSSSDSAGCASPVHHRCRRSWHHTTVPLFHLGGDRWRVQVSDGFRNGKRRLISKTFHADPPGRNGKPSQRTQAEARILEGRLLEQTRKSANTITVNGLLDRWLAFRTQHGASPSTLRQERSKVARIRADLGTMRVGELRGHHVDDWTSSMLAAGMSPANVHHHWRILRAVLNEAERWELVDRSPVRRSRAPQVRKYRPNVPTTGSLVLLVQQAPPWLRTVAHLAMASGLRRGELCGLRWSDLVDGRLVVSRSMMALGRDVVAKGPKSEAGVRVVTLDESTLVVLGSWRARQVRYGEVAGAALPDDWWMLAETPLDGPVRPDRLTQAWKRHSTQQGAPCRFHDLRHWHVTQLVGSGLPLPDASRRAGHAQVTTTANIYAQALPAGDKAAAEIMANLLTPPRPERGP